MLARGRREEVPTSPELAPGRTSLTHGTDAFCLARLCLKKASPKASVASHRARAKFRTHMVQDINWSKKWRDKNGWQLQGLLFSSHSAQTGRWAEVSFPLTNKSAGSHTTVSSSLSCLLGGWWGKEGISSSGEFHNFLWKASEWRHRMCVVKKFSFY